jgi:hypothetical protein
MVLERHGWTLGLAMVLGWGSSACGPVGGEVEVRCEGWEPGGVVLTELLPDPESVDTGQEWVEVHNPGGAAVDLRGLTLYAARPDGSREKGFVFLESLWVEAGDYLVLGDVRSESLPAQVDFSYGDGLGALSNTGGRVGLRCGELVVDEVAYAGPLRAGVARMYDGRYAPDADDNDAPERWCDAPASADGSRGSPGSANPGCEASPGGADGGVGGDGGTPGDGGVSEETCLSETGGTRAVVPPQPGDVVLTELMVDPKAVADAMGEWVELYVRREVDFNGVTLANEGSGRATLEGARCLRVEAGAHAVLARSAEYASNGGLPPVLGTFGFSLGNSAASRALRLSRKGVLLDEVRWTSEALPGVSWQLEPSRRSPEGNDEPGSFCATPEGTRYGGGDRGTPGGENRPCGP